jgi:hypothetical protein
MSLSDAGGGGWPTSGHGAEPLSDERPGRSPASVWLAKHVPETGTTRRVQVVERKRRGLRHKNRGDIPERACQSFDGWNEGALSRRRRLRHPAGGLEVEHVTTVPPGNDKTGDLRLSNCAV